MILIYAYINKFKNYTPPRNHLRSPLADQFFKQKLSIQYRGSIISGCGYPRRWET